MRRDVPVLKCQKWRRFERGRTSKSICSVKLNWQFLFLYSYGLKLRMPHPFRSRCPKECRRGGKILKNPGKMQFSGTCNLSWSFCNESFVGKFCENLQRNMRLSATHRMPPAKKSRSQHVKHLKPIFSKYSVYVGFYVLCAAHIECRQKHIQMSSFCCKISVFLWNTWFEGLYKFTISYE